MLDELITEARGWLADCGLIPDAATINDSAVIRRVHRFYDGGWPAFVTADITMDIAVVWLLMVRRYGLEFANEMNPKR